MNVLNRILVIVLILAGIALAGGFVFLAWAPDRDLHGGSADQIQFVLDVNADGSARLIATVVAGAVIALLVLLLLMEVRPRRRKQLKLRPAGGDAVYVPEETLVQRIEEDALRVPHVETARAGVEVKGKGVAVDLTLGLDPETEIAPTVEAVSRAVEEGLSNKFGVPLAGRPRIHVRYQELRIGRPAEQAAAPPAAEEPGPAPARPQDLPTQVVTVPPPAEREGPTDETPGR
ncbi:MAG TPA: alkaline shock response membrane anchor protein AmaP [Dehalococcoidia bacterium]